VFDLTASVAIVIDPLQHSGCLAMVAKVKVYLDGC